MGPDAMILLFWMLSFKPTFKFSSFTFIKSLFSFSSLSAISVASSAYLRLLIFLLESWFQLVLHLARHFTWLYSACKLNKQGDNTQPWCTPFPIWNQSVVPCPVQTIASWPAYRFLRRQVKWSAIPISFRIFQFVVIHTVKVFGIVKAMAPHSSTLAWKILWMEEPGRLQSPSAVILKPKKIKSDTNFTVSHLFPMKW